MLAVTWDTIRLFLHVLAATVWVGGQLVLAALVPVLRRFGAEVPRAAARRFNQVAWIAFAVLVATGVWNVIAVSGQPGYDASYQATLIVKVAVVAVSGVTAFLHARARRAAGLAVFGALTGASALAALFLGVLLAGLSCPAGETVRAGSSTGRHELTAESNELTPRISEVTPPDGSLPDFARQLWEIEQIKQLKARYFRLMDTKDWDAWRELFTEDCVHHLPGELNARPQSNAEYLELVPRQLADAFTTHHGHMPEITLLSPTEATGVWAMFDYVLYPDRPTGIKGYGHYHETYRKGEDGRWRISSKRNQRLRVDQVPNPQWTPAEGNGP